MVEDRDKKYKFIIGIPTYDIAEHSDKRLGESDNTSISIRDIRISYIRKFGTDGPRLISKGQPINNFNYFQYLFGRHDIHTQFVGVIKRILIELHGDPSLSSKNKFAK
ncbi:hypothetical protein H7170_04015 [Candidatus Gracilibacteria bacterium]|nr:hypothetical protein [Candidatus Gracilibacteria bacterium]